MRRITLFVLLIGVLLFVTGCTRDPVSSVPECELVRAPDPAKYAVASTDEQLVMMTNSYVGQVRKTSECNTNIRKVNAKNETLFK